MLSYAIVIKDHPVSEKAFERLQSSTELKINRFDAIVPEEVEEKLALFGVEWDYPWTGQEVSITAGLRKSAYPTKNKKARIAAALSHYTLWHMTLVHNSPVLILEHDAIFDRPINFDPDSYRYDVIGINNPIGATRRSAQFHSTVQLSEGRIVPVPWIDDKMVPQGLAGNSAYIIKPRGAKALIKAVDDYGLWPNDAIMCKQLIPNMGVTKEYYTRVQGTRSTTTL